MEILFFISDHFDSLFFIAILLPLLFSILFVGYLLSYQSYRAPLNFYQNVFYKYHINDKQYYDFTHLDANDKRVFTPSYVISISSK